VDVTKTNKIPEIISEELKSFHLRLSKNEILTKEVINKNEMKQNNLQVEVDENKLTWDSLDWNKKEAKRIEEQD
jgi:hypothetical protein